MLFPIHVITYWSTVLLNISTPVSFTFYINEAQPQNQDITSRSSGSVAKLPPPRPHCYVKTMRTARSPASRKYPTLLFIS